ncbi:MAG: hypothetical protein COT91_04635 [Candidatus Doudnabacteria bacterium CG10_big_fil_rev_8_21_14_0_10_41_10]|uniref:Glycosyltransferase 2-like domain-containing protein n=1 Tax=Candidatus Doudnabacteria bacterium CG10_big_fil_rev_8_21_14_0_10_41_10 TaxID=1974551 RepID=A0A2H0VEV7_9BACT|nr:MAG: hypothetical protein COT91_04635 [Candidatus Doudnabacteria bacterium CG10_big_fil_rev_8_21_14_0_10_41_10]
MGFNGKFTDQNRPDLSLVILCYKAREYTRDFVVKVIEVLEKYNIHDYELILVGNYIEGTGDTTPQVVEELSKQYPKVFHVAKPKKGMMGWDMKSGFEKARGNYIAVIDGDGQMPIFDIIRVYHKIREENLDMVKTVRLVRGDGVLRRFISFVYNLFARSFFPGIAGRDINAKPKIFRRKVFEKFNLTSDDWFIDAEIMIHARRHKIEVREIPTEFLGLVGRRSFISLKISLEFIKNLIVHRWREFFRK